MICWLSSSYAPPEPHQEWLDPWHVDVERWARTRQHGTEPKDPVWRIYTIRTKEKHREFINELKHCVEAKPWPNGPVSGPQIKLV